MTVPEFQVPLFVMSPALAELAPSTTAPVRVPLLVTLVMPLLAIMAVPEVPICVLTEPPKLTVMVLGV